MINESKLEMCTSVLLAPIRKIMRYININYTRYAVSTSVNAMFLQIVFQVLAYTTSGCNGTVNYNAVRLQAIVIV